jgi:hypothetical protein
MQLNTSNEHTCEEAWSTRSLRLPQHRVGFKPHPLAQYKIFQSEDSDTPDGPRPKRLKLVRVKGETPESFSFTTTGPVLTVHKGLPEGTYPVPTKGLAKPNTVQSLLNPLFFDKGDCGWAGHSVRCKRTLLKWKRNNKYQENAPETGGISYTVNTACWQQLTKLAMTAWGRRQNTLEETLI